MPELIEIEGNVASIITKSVVRQVPLDELIKGLERVPPITLPSIARTQIFSHYIEDAEIGETRTLILCELPPAIRSITKENRRHNPRGMRRYRLAIPWTYFWFWASTSDSSPATTTRWSVGEGRVFFAKEQYQDINSPMIPAFLPNLDRAGGICWGTTAVPAHTPLSTQIDGRVNNWYLTNFNDDLDNTHSYPYGENSFRRWVEESRNDARCWEHWTEFNEAARITSVQKLLTEHAQVPASVRFEGMAFIPEIEMPATFGRWDEWWSRLSSTERARALRSAQNVQEDIGETFEAQENTGVDNDYDTDDGGVPV